MTDVGVDIFAECGVVPEDVVALPYMYIYIYIYIHLLLTSFGSFAVLVEFTVPGLILK